MNLQQLSYFLNIAESKSLTKSATKLFLSQSALSRSIQALEKEMGVSLFHKSTTGMELSEQGLLFFDYAYKAVQEYNDIMLVLHENERTQFLNIAFTHNVNLDYCTDLIHNFNLAHPSLQINFKQYLEHSQIIEQIIEEKIDFLFGASQIMLDFVDKSQQLEYIIIRPTQWRVYLARNHHLAVKSSLTIQDLQHENLLVNSTDFVRLLHENSPNTQTTFVEAGKSALLDITAKNNFLFLGPADIPYNNKTMLCKKVDNLPCEDFSVLAWKKQKKLSPNAKQFKNFIHNCIKTYQS